MGKHESIKDKHDSSKDQADAKPAGGDASFIPPACEDTTKLALATIEAIKIETPMMALASVEAPKLAPSLDVPTLDAPKLDLPREPREEEIEPPPG